MTPPSRIAFIGNSLPRRCGIATFTTDLQQAIATSSGDMETRIVAMSDHGHAYDYPSIVGLQVNDQKIEDYALAADAAMPDSATSLADSRSPRPFRRHQKYHAVPVEEEG